MRNEQLPSMDAPNSNEFVTLHLTLMGTTIGSKLLLQVVAFKVEFTNNNTSDQCFHCLQLISYIFLNKLTLVK